MSQGLHHCRFCGKASFEPHKYFRMFQYGRRHWAHADCGLKAKGDEFLSMIPEFDLPRFPYFAAKEADALSMLELLLEVARTRGVEA